MNEFDDINVSNLTDNHNDKNIHTFHREQRGIRAENALIEDIFTRNRTGYITISYGIMDRNQMVHMQVVTLIYSNNTRIRDQFGNRSNFRNLRVGMVINVRFSSIMTRSIPPQTRAYNITIVQESASSLIEEGRVINVDASGDFGYILTGVRNSPNRQMRYVISDATKLRDRRGNRINLGSIRPGQIVRIERNPFQTMSIPPQTSALSVQII